MNRKKLFECKSGSYLYGTNTPSSDEDYASIFMPNPHDLLGLQKMEYIDNSTKSSSEDRRNSVEDVDDISYSLPRYIHLVIHGNPNLTELLFAPKNIISITSPIYDEIVAMKDKIISNRIIHSFSGFAYAQFKKLTTKSNRYRSLEKGIRFIETRFSKYIQPNSECYAISQVEGEELSKVIEYYKGQKNNIEPFHKGMDIKMIYEKVKYEYDNYGWRVKTDTFEELGFDCKFASHAIRLYMEGIELLTTGSIEFPLKDKQLILDVKNGKYNLAEITKLYNDYEAQIKEIAAKSVLRNSPDFNYVNDWLVKVLSQSIYSEVGSGKQ